MAGPWEDYAPISAPAVAGPWSDYQALDVLEQATPQHPGGLLNAIKAGLQSSATGLALRGKLPDTQLSPDAAWYERALSSFSGLVADVPEMIAGGAAGSFAGPVGTAAGAFAAPTAIREALMQAYEQGGAGSWEEVWNIVKAGGAGAAEGAVIGAATGAAGKFARGFAAGASPLVRGTAVVGAEVTALTTAGAALEGRMPTAQDFLDAAILVGGLHAVTPVAQRLRNIYAKTGVSPSDVALESMKDPALKEELVLGFREDYSGFMKLAIEREKTQGENFATLFEQYSSVVELPLSELFATQKTISTDKARQIDLNGAPLPDVVQLGGRLYINDGHHRLLAAVSQGDVNARVNFANSDTPGAPPSISPKGEPVTATVPARYQALAAAENAKAAVPDLAELTPEARAEAIELAKSPFAEVPQAPGAPKLKGNVNYEYINSDADLKGAVARIVELNKDNIDKATRGRVSVEETVQASKQHLADALGVSAERLPPEIGIPQEQLAALNYARAQATVDMTAAWKRMAGQVADAADKGTLTDPMLAQFRILTEKTGMVVSSHLGLSAEVGRALQIMKTFREQLRDIKALDEIIEANGKRGDLIDLARMGKEAKDAAAAAKAAREYTKPTTLQKVLEIWKAMILSGPTSHMANIFGSHAAGTFILPENAIAALIGKVRGGEPGISFTEIRARAVGMRAGYLDGLKLAGETIRGATDSVTGKLDLPGIKPIFNAKKGGLLPFRLLTAEDIISRVSNERGEAYALATRRALSERLPEGTREFNTRVMEIVQNPETALNAKDAAAFMDAVKAAGDEIAFTKKLGPFGRHIQMAVRGTPMEFIMPFIKTPANLLKWGAERVPGVNFLMKSVRDDLAGKNGKIAQDMALSRMVMGSVVLTTIGAAATSGIITGGGLADPEQKKTKLAAGWQPYSLKIGDTYYSYMRIDPIARLLATAADVVEIYNASEHNDKLNLAGVMVGAIGNATVSQTYLSGLSNAINAITDPNRYGGRWLDQYAASLVPALIGQTAGAIDPKTREINSVLDAIQSRIPLFREQLLPKRNPLTGEEVKAPEKLFPLAPIPTTIRANDPVLLEAERLGVNLANAPKKVHVGRNTGKIGDVEITPEQRNLFTQKQGEFAHRILSPIVNSPGWGSIPDVAKTQIYKKILGAARQQAALAALPPEARIAEATRIAQEMAAQFSNP